MPDDKIPTRKILLTTEEQMDHAVDRMILGRTITALEINSKKHQIVLTLDGCFELKFQCDPDSPPYTIRYYQEEPEG